MYERHNQPLLSRERFLIRQVNHFLIVLGIIVGSLGIACWATSFRGSFLGGCVSEFAMLLEAWARSIHCIP